MPETWLGNQKSWGKMAFPTSASDILLPGALLTVVLNVLNLDDNLQE